LWLLRLLRCRLNRLLYLGLLLRLQLLDIQVGLVISRGQPRSNRIHSGTGYVEGFDTSTDAIKFTVNATTSQLYDLNIVYDGPYGDKYTYVVLNGAGGSQVSLPATTAWTTVAGGQVLLNAGSNTIEIQNNWGWYLIDAITLSPSAKRGPHHVTTTPVNTNANSDAKALLHYLGSIYGKKILSGQQDQASLDWVTTNVGKTPAILGVDFMGMREFFSSSSNTSPSKVDLLSYCICSHSEATLMRT